MANKKVNCLTENHGKDCCDSGWSNSIVKVALFLFEINVLTVLTSDDLCGEPRYLLKNIYLFASRTIKNVPHQPNMGIFQGKNCFWQLGQIVPT